MKASLFVISAFFGLLHALAAQGESPFVSPAEQKAVNEQDAEFNRALTPSLSAAAASTVRVWTSGRRLAYGTVVADGGKVLTKWSEIARFTRSLRVEAADGRVFTPVLAGVYADEDLAVLELPDAKLPAVKWTKTPPALGAFIAAVQPGGQPAGFGVVSVLDRNLRDQDQAYLGVIGVMKHAGPGVKIEDVAPGSGAAAAGLRPGEVILKVGERPISGVLELRNSLVGVKPGSSVDLLVGDGAAGRTVKVLLGNRPNLPKFPGDRLRQMEQMGSELSRVRDSFGRVIQTDMRLDPNQVGGPVVGLDGSVIGISIARASRTHSYVIPADEVLRLLGGKPQDPALAQAPRNEQAPAFQGRMLPGQRQGRQRPVDPQRMRRQVDQMEELLEFMRQEMDALEGNR